MRILSLAALLWLVWTNPPDRDLGWIAILAQQAGRCDTLAVALVNERGRFGQRDSTRVELPCTTRPIAYTFWPVACDSLGNCSADGNHVDALWEGR